MSVSLLRMHDGRIALHFLRKQHHKDLGLLCMPEVCFSDDECETFTRPTPVIQIPGYYVVNNDRIVQLKNGRIVVPVGVHRTRWPSWPEEGKRPGAFLASAAMVFFYYSDDGGRTWWESESNLYRCFRNGHGLQEPGVVELKGGRLWSWSRAGAFGIEGSHGYQWQSFSKDEGVHWSEIEPSRFRSPCSPMSVKRIPQTGDLLAVWNDHSDRTRKSYRLPKPKPSSWGRTPLACAISEDEGRSWKHHRLLEKSPDHGFCYAAVHFTDDAALFAYCSGGASTKMVLDRLRVRRVMMEDLYG